MIRNCFNYVGSKDRIFSVIDKNLDKDKKFLVDLFCGSAVVGINEINNYDKVILNDACWQVVETLRYFRDSKFEELENSIDNVIQKFELSKTNKDGYNKLRDFYNNVSNTPDTFNPVLFYCLLTHSFNYNIHINSSGGFSVPFGANRSSFNSSLRKKLENFQRALHENSEKVEILKSDFSTLPSINIKETVFYCASKFISFFAKRKK